MLHYDRFAILPAFRAIAIFGCLCCTNLVAESQADTSDQNATIVEVLYSGPLGALSPRLPAVVADPVVQQLSRGNFPPPQAGQVSGRNFRGEEQHWRAIGFDESGTITDRSLRGGYLYLGITAEDDQSIILSPDGVSDVFVDGASRAGDVYGNG